MAEKVRLEENIPVSNSDSAVTSNTSSISSTMESRGLLMTHSSSESRSAPSSNNIRGFNHGARTTEHSRTNANNIPLTFDENELVEQTRVQPGISLSTLLNIQRLQNQVRTQIPSSPSDSIVINVEDQPTTSGEHQHLLLHDLQQTMGTENFLNNIREAANEIAAENRNNNNVEDDPVAVHIRPQVRAMLKVLEKYVPFILILLAKGIYDHRTGVLNFIVLLITFHHANNVLKREIAKQHNRSWTSLLVITCYIVASIIFIDYKFETHLFSAYTQPLTIWELLWSVLVTDFVLKLITIVFKVILTCVPARLLALQKRGKYYLMVEATSQLYRCIAPVQPWLYYLFEAYQGPEKILGVFLSVSYTVSKGSDLLSHVKLFHSAVCKLLQNLNLGVSPSKEQLIASGGICAICHEEYSMPVRLHCKHIFCETCVSTWLDRERSCPLCRAAITDDPIYRDGHTTHFIQLY